jgi:hypothetical protein
LANLSIRDKKLYEIFSFDTFQRYEEQLHVDHVESKDNQQGFDQVPRGQYCKAIHKEKNV